jgi:integrase
VKRSGQIVCATCKRAECTCIGGSSRKWFVRVFVGRDAAGKRKYVSKLVHGNRKAADAALAKLLTKKSDGTLAPQTKDTVDGYLDSWLDTTAAPSVRPQTLAEYKRILKSYVRPHVGELRLSRLTAADVRAMIVKLSTAGGKNGRELAPRTVRMAHEVLRNALEQAVTDGLIPANPARGRAVAKSLPKMERTERVTLPADRIGEFLDVVKGDPTAAYWVLLLFTGLRPSEALALRWKDIHGDSVRVTRVLVHRRDVPVHFAPPKSASSRRAVQVPDVVLRALAEHRKRQAAARLAAGAAWNDQGLIFPTETGEPMAQQRMREVFARLLKAADLPAMRVYDLRHSCATLLLEKGLSLKIVSERLGHSTTALTADTYSHVTPGMQQQATDVLEDLAR